MERFKKLFASTVLVATVMSMCMVAAPAVKAAASAGDLIKMNGLASVYYLAGDGKRYVFPNSTTYFSWYADFSGVKTIPQSELESYPLGANVTMRPGTKLVKITTNPKVYVVTPGGKLTAIPDEATAKTLYGDNWAKRIVDVPDAFFNNYKDTGNTVSATAYPEGSLIKTAGDPNIYYIASDGKARKVASEAAFNGNRFNWNDVITTTLAIPAAGADITGAESTLTDTSSGAGGTAGAGTGLTVALASDTPASASIPVGTNAATNVPFMKFNLTAASDGAVTVNSLTVKRIGVGQYSDFSYVYLYEGNSRLTSGKSISSANNTATFTGLNYTVPAGTTKTLTLMADMSGTNTSGSDAFQIVDTSAVATNGASVSGSFPITGNTMSLANISVGKLKVTAGVDPSAPSVGAQGVELAQFKMEASTEDIKVSRIALYQGGTISNSYLTNFKLYDGSTVLASQASISAKNLVSFTLDTPLTIPKGQTKTFDMKGDISGSAKNGDTIIFYVENSTDIYGVGQTYGFGVAVDTATTGTYDGSSAANESNCTVSGGQLTFASSGPVAANVRGNGVDFMDFSIAAGVNTEIKSLRLELINGGLKSGATSTNGYITNVRIVDKATNAVVAGPLDLGNTSSWTDITTGSLANLGSYHDFTDTITIAAGTSKNFKVLADLNNSLSAGPIYVVLGSTASGWVLSTTAGAKNTDNNQWITDIVPSTKITGNQMTFTTAALTVSAANSPATKTVSKGDQNIESLGIVLAPATNQSARVTSIKVAGYLSGLQTGSGFELYSKGSETIRSTVSSLDLYDGTTKLGQSKSFDTSGYATFDNLSVTVPSAGKTLTVKANLSSTATTTGSFAIEIPTPRTFVVADDGSGTSITPDDATASNVTINTSPTVYIKVTAGGSLTAALNSDFPTAIVAGNTAVDMLSTKFFATNQAMTITKLRVVKTNTADADASNISITYAKDAAGTPETVTTTFVATVADFSGLNIYVPKDDYSKNITFKVQTGTVGSGATSGDSISLALNTTNFEAVSAEGGSTKATTFTGTVSGATDHVMYIRKGYPTFTQAATSYSGSQTIGGVSKLTEFGVTATGGTVALKKVKFNITLSDGQYGSGYTDLSATDFKLFRNGTEVSNTNYRIYRDNVATSTSTRIDAESTSTGTVATTTTAFYVVFDQGTTSGGEETISAGTTNTYAIGATISGFESARDSITTSIAASTDTSATRNLNLISATNYYVALTGPINENLIWSDMNTGASHSAVLDNSSADWASGYKVSIK